MATKKSTGTKKTTKKVTSDETKAKKPTKKSTTEKPPKKSPPKKPLPADKWWFVHDEDGSTHCVVFTTSTKKVDHLQDVKTIAWYQDINGAGVWAVHYKVNIDSFDLEALKELLGLTNEHRAVDYEVPKPKPKK